jgi:hypothetical protein
MLPDGFCCFFFLMKLIILLHISLNLTTPKSIITKMTEKDNDLLGYNTFPKHIVDEDMQAAH